MFFSNNINNGRQIQKVDFKVVARNENRYGNMEMSWTKDIFIKYLDIKIEINKNRVLKLNNERVYPPFILPDGTRIEKSGNYISVSTFFGIQIFYDGDGNAEIKVGKKKFYFHIINLEHYYH